MTSVMVASSDTAGKDSLVGVENLVPMGKCFIDVNEDRRP